ncbi:MAG: calcium-binding protein, partial [Hyphomicrobium sp.]
MLQEIVGLDQLRFTAARSADVAASVDGLDLILTIDAANSVRIKDQFLGDRIDPLFGNNFAPDTGVGTILFADGVIWDWLDIAMAVSRPLPTDDLVVGTESRDFLDGGTGNDILRGGRDGDHYVFREGSGQDRIIESNDWPTDDRDPSKIDILRILGDISLGRIHFMRAGESDDVLLTVLDVDGNPTGDSISIEGQFDWFNAPFVGLIFGDRIERIAFANGEALSDVELMGHVLSDLKSPGSDVIYGFNNADRMDGGAGDDVLVGRAQDDTYVFGRGYGRDVVFDQHNDLFGRSFDVVEFGDDLRWTDFEFERTADSPTITLRIKGSDEALTLKDSYQSEVLLGFVNMVERLDFADGTSWDYAKLAQHVVDLQFSPGDDLAYGFEIDDRMDAGAGNDRLEGGAGADTYVFARGYGNDTVRDLVSERVGDKVLFRDIAFDDVDISRAGEDLVFTIRDTGERLVIEGQYARIGQVLHGLSGYQPHAVETFVFSDGSVSFRDLAPDDVDAVGTAAAETIHGSDFAETLDGRGGDDTLIGGSDGDTYLFDAGYGSDIIVDRQQRVVWFDPQRGALKEGDDTIRFGDDLTPDNVAFAKDGDDLLISVVGRTDTLRVRSQFRSIEDEIEWFAFKDGTRLHISDVEERLAIVGGSRGDDRIEGVEDAANVLDGRQGDDTLIGGRLGDTYAFGAAYDLDQIIESATGIAGAIDRVVFSASVAKDAIVISRSGDDLVIDLGNGEDRLTITDGFGARQVERFEFADGSFWTLDEI